MNERIREIRKSMNMNQTEFANLLGVGQSTLAMMEVSKRDISDRHIKTICAICKVNEQWIRTGEGEMFEGNGDDFLSELAAKYQLNAFQKNLARIVYEMPLEHQEIILMYAEKLAAANEAAEESDDERAKRIVRAARAEADQAEADQNADKRA